MLVTKALSGAGGVFHATKFDVRGLRGSGPDGSVVFEDLWEGEPGNWRPRYPDRVVQDMRFKNKFLKRALAYMLHTALNNHTSGPANFVHTDITVGPTDNPFGYFVVVADLGGTPADALVEWEEADGSNAKIPVRPGGGWTSPEGYRVVSLNSGTSGPGLHRISAQHLSGSPYRELEYVLFAGANGSALENGDDEIDNLPIKAVGLSAGPLVGNGEANSRWGVRAVVGLAPTFQGISDRVYLHEPATGAADLHKYLTTETILANGEGYVQSSNLAEAQIDSQIPTNAGNDIVAATKVITLPAAATGLTTTSGFDNDVHRRKVLRIANAVNGGNNRDYTIKRVISATQVEVFEAPAADETTTAITGDVFTVYTGDKMFDGRVANEGRVEGDPTDGDPDGTILLGEYWRSAAGPGPHTAGRVFPAAVGGTAGVIGARITFPAGLNKDFCPKFFRLEYLADAGGGANQPVDDSWTLCPGQDYGAVDQSDNIFNAGEKGYEYIFSSPVTGAIAFRMTAITSFGGDATAVAVFHIFENLDNTGTGVALSAGVDDKLELRTRFANFRSFLLGTIAATQDVQDFVDAINAQIRGYEMEAVRSDFGYLWLRATVAGDNADCIITDAGGNNANTKLGLPTGGPQTNTGITQTITKAFDEALTLIYRLNISGDLPVP
jgi:hypothetical protein